MQNELIIIESKTYYGINMSLSYKHPTIGYKIETLKWKNHNWMKLLNRLNIEIKSLNKNRNIEYK